MRILLAACWCACAFILAVSEVCIANEPGGGGAWFIASIFDRSNNGIDVMVSDAPAVRNGHCVAYVRANNKKFTALSVAGSGKLPRCKVSDFPSSYFEIGREVNVDEAIMVSKAMRKLSSCFDSYCWDDYNLSAHDIDFLRVGGVLRRIDFYSLSKSPWGLLFCSRGNLFFSENCKLVNLKVSEGWNITSVSVSDVME